AVDEAAEPEDLAEHRSVLQQALLVARKQVEARGDDSLHRFGHRKLVAVPSLEVHLRVLLRVERIAAGLCDEALLRFGIEDRLLEKSAEQTRRFGLGKRRERDRRSVELSSAPPRPPLEQLRARGTDDEDWNGRRPVDEM